MKYSGLEIAIIGMAGRFPGADNIYQFWDNIKNGVESITFLKEEELLKAGESRENLDNPNYVKASARVENKAYFDAAFFNYRPDEARLMDPQMRLFHECAVEALEHAGCDPATIEKKIGVFAGAATNTNWVIFSELLNQKGLVDPFSASKLNNARFIPTKISYALNLKGPSIFLDTACSTSLVAIEQACKSLLLAECNIALAGGCTLNPMSNKGYTYKEGMILSKDGHCSAFDENASGTVGGEGAAMVVLKTMKNALKDGDNILAIIKGGGVNNDGRNKVGYTAPSVDGQTEVILKAHKWAKVKPESISLIEAHGTGTKLGDPIEVEALNRVFGSSKNKYCALGTLKSNVGHLDTAAGAAGVIKTVFALKNRKLPPSLNFKKPNSDINFKQTPFYVNTELKEWKTDQTPLRAGVSAFGIGGTNAHVVLEEAPIQKATSESRKQQLLLLSAKSPAALQRNIEKFKTYLLQKDSAKLADIAYTLQTGRMAHAYRKTIVCDSKAKAISQLSEKEDNQSFPFLAEKSKQPIVFMFSGQGSQYLEMCRDLYQQEPIFKQEVDKCFTYIKRKHGKALHAIVFPTGNGKTADINNTEFTQPILFTIEYALAQLLMEWGIKPDVMLGHSIGEYVAACISGVFTLETALTIVVKRGEIMQRAAKGAMLSVATTEKELKPILKAKPDISLAAVNSTERCVVAGPTKAIDRIKTELESNYFACKAIRTSHAFHSQMMDGILQAFKNVFRGITLNEPKLPFFSNLTGKPCQAAQVTSPEYWVKHLRNTVKFADSINTLLENKEAIFIEVGPGKALSSLVRSNKQKEDSHLIINLVRHPKEAENDNAYLLKGIAKLWTNGITPDWTAFYKAETRRKVALPTYSFEKVKYPVNVDAFQMISDMMGGKGLAALNETLDNLTQETGPQSKESGTVNSIDTSLSPDSTAYKLISLWNGFFGKNDIQSKDDFFEIGGDSLQAATMIAKMAQVFGVKISLTDFFKNATIKALSQQIDALQEESGDALAQQITSIPLAEKQEVYGLSAAQKRLYFLYEFDKKSLAYNLPQVVKIEGKLDIVRLNEAINKVIAEQESLRSSFHIVSEIAVQKIAPSAKLDIAEISADGADEAVLIQQFIQPFDLSQAPLMRVGLVEKTDTDFLLMMDIHHIVSDGVSQAILVREIMNAYNLQEVTKLSLQYKDYAAWQQSEAQQKETEKQKEFWLNEFAEEVNTLVLPTDYRRPTVKTYEGSQVKFKLSKEQSSQLKAMAKEEGTTMFTLLFAVYNLLLSKLGSQEDIVIGIPTAGRQQAALADMIGMFVNTVALRNSVESDLPFKSFLAEVKSKTLACFDHQQYQYEDLVDELKIGRNTGHNPLFDVFFSFQNIGDVALEIDNLSIKSYESELNISQFDLSLWAEERDEQLQLKFEYATALFKSATIEKFIGYFQNIITTILANRTIEIAAISTITLEEKAVLAGYNSTNLAYPKEKNIATLFEEMVKNRQEAPALTFKDKSLSYTELNEKSNQLAHKISKNKVGKSAVIGILLNRSENMLISILAVLKTGCAYLPIDPDYPVERIKYVVTNSDVQLLLTEPALSESATLLPTGIELIDVTASDVLLESKENLNLDFSAEELAYLIYTSGSTGLPKGVMIEHKSVVNFVHGVRQKIDFSPDNVILCLTTISFDIFVLETLLPLLTGMKIVIASAEDQKDPNAIITMMQSQQVDMLQMTPSHLKMLLAHKDAKSVLENIKAVMVGGEAFPLEVLNDLKACYQNKIYNMYGPTEATVWSTIQDLTASPTVKIGQPIANTTIHILDKGNRPVSPAVAGELCIGGDGLARGYWGNEPLTAEKFISLADGQRVYRTGDLAKWSATGQLEFLGRMDNQVKIRGFRIELGEIENQLQNHQAIQETVVAVRQKQADKYLIAYYVAAEEITTNELINHLSGTLPNYMIPTFYIHLNQLPLTPNGKLDRKVLQELEVQFTTEFVAASNEIEEQLVEIWAEILDMEKDLISVNQSFFTIGGHSLKAMVMINKINKQFDLDIPLQEIFNKQHITALADYLYTILQLNGDLIIDDNLTEITL